MNPSTHVKSWVDIISKCNLSTLELEEGDFLKRDSLISQISMLFLAKDPASLNKVRKENYQGRHPMPTCDLHRHTQTCMRTHIHTPAPHTYM